MAAEVDSGRIASFVSISESTISTLIENPTAELVKSFLSSLTPKIQEYEELRSQKLKQDIELETAIRTNESKVKVHKASVEKGLAEIGKLRTELQQSENSRLKLESDLAQLKSATSTEASETSALKSRVASLEASNRETIAVLESKSSSYNKLAEDLSTQHQRTVELRRQVAQLEQDLQSANSTASSTRFREQNLEQEIELLKKNNEWLDTELKTKSAEHLKFRKDRSARISELQRQNELTLSENESLKRNEASLKSRLDEQVQRVEELLTEIQQLKEENIQQAESHRLDLDNTTRLAELQRQRAESANARVQELSTSLEEVREEASDEIGRLRAEVETEQQEREAAEQRVSELETSVEQLESELSAAKASEGPATPSRGVNGHGSATPIRAGTPTGLGSPMSISRFRGSLSTTQLYSECRKLEKQLISEQHRNEELSATLEDVAKDLEANKPEIEQLRGDHARLEAEMVEMSALMDAAAKERDNAMNDARRARGELDGLSIERNALLQQNRDLGSQIKVLLAEQHLRDNGHSMSPDEFANLETVSRISASELESMTDTGRFISEHLTIFKNISELQENNSKVLRMLRELGERMESEEARERDEVRQKEREELEQLRVKVATYKDELQAMITQSRSYVKERDMFRSMLTRRGQLSNIDTGDFARSMPLPAGETAGSPQPSRFGQSLHGSASNEVDYAKLLKDLQIHFDSYKQEAATDHTALKNQVNDLSKKNSDLQTENSRTSSQLSTAVQRGEMLQANFDMLRAENNELQKRVYSVMENATKQELKAQQVAEELVEAHGTLESIRREAANLKAEKDLWKNIEKRLVEDNEALRNERARLDKLNSSLQNMLNEREQVDNETRRRLQASIESLEAELQTSKRKLSDEMEESRKATLRREYEHEQNQKRIDDLVTSLGSVREELSAAKTSKDHLQARTEELTVELRSAEERVQVLQKPAAPQPPETVEASQNLVSREQELAVEVSELKRDLDLRAAEIDRANEQIEDYKNIAQQAEERLQELVDTNDQYREETDRTLEERAKKIQELEQRIEDISSELGTTNNELSKLRDEQSDSSRRLEEQKAMFEAEISRLKDEGERNATAAQFHQEDLKAQAEIAQRAQQNYETELVRHAEAAKNLQAVRSEASQLKLELVGLRSEADTARSSLTQKEESWTEQKDRYERELLDLRKRRDEALQQNNILHQQMEDLTNQIAALQRNRAALTETEGEATSTGDLQNLQEVIKYLRREKEIVDVQYHLSLQESKRLRQQLDHSQSQLDETRLKLDQQRRAEADTERATLNHNKLMETLNELNLFRESSVTLRAQFKEAETNLTERSRQVQELTSQIEPLQIRIGELENVLETREGELKIISEDRDRWRDRTNNIMAKYNRVDPEEVEAQKEKLAALQKERDEAVAEKAQLQTEIDSFPERIETAKQDLRSRLGEQFKTRSKQLTTRIAEKQSELDAANAEKSNLETQLQSVKEELETARSAPTAEPQTNGDPMVGISDQSTRIQELEARVAQLESTAVSKEQELQALRAEYEQKTKEREAELKQALAQQATKLRSEHEASLKNALETAEGRLKASHERELHAARSQDTQQPPASPQQQKPAENATNGVAASPTTASADELPALSDAQVRLLVQKNELVRTILRNNIQKAVAKAKEDAKKDLQAAADAAEASVSSSAFEALEKKHTTEKDSLANELRMKLNNEKEAALKEQEEKFSNEKLTFSKESEKKIADQVAMAEKRSAAKINLAQNQAKISLYRLGIVKKAATDTPEKAVKEVWDEASVAKPPAAPAPSPGPAPAPVAASPLKTSSPAPAPPSSPVPEAKDQTTKVPTPEPSSSAVEETTTTPNQMVQPEPRAKTPTIQENATAQQANTGVQRPANDHLTGTGPAALRQLQSGLPRGGRGGRGGLQASKFALGGGQAQPGGLNENPFAQSQQGQQQPASRGSGIPRGGARGRGGQGRAGATNVQTSGIPQPGAGGASSMNPQARQFNPGNKRTREDSDGSGNDANAGKRIRGGGVGS